MITSVCLLLAGKWASCKRPCRWQQHVCSPWRRHRAPRRLQPSLPLLDGGHNRRRLRVNQHSPALAASMMGSPSGDQQAQRACPATARLCRQPRTPPVLRSSSQQLQPMSRLPSRWQCSQPTVMCKPYRVAYSAGWIWLRTVTRFYHHQRFRRCSTAALR